MTDFLSQLRRTVGAAYDIERELTGGGMSRVYVATERSLGRQVVIKVLPPDLAAGVNMERFRREIQLAAQLHHPHIVPLLSTGEGNGILYYTMPYIEGESLRVAVERTGPFPVADVIRVLHDVVDALAYAHGRGVIHRDIKPANILRLGSHALVTDFGVAKALSASMPVSGVTTAGFAIGTPAYMAPEQLAGDPAADHRIDLYAVGLLAYELLTGSSPFSSSSPQATLAAQLTRTPEPLHELRPEVSPALSDLIDRCLEKNPELRPPTAVALQAELDAVSTPRGALLAGGEATVRVRSRPTAGRGALIGAAVVVVLSAAAYAVALQRSSDDGVTTSDSSDLPAVSVGPIDSSQVGASGSPQDTATQPVVLSRADSLAIADAVNTRLETERAARGVLAQAIADSLRPQIQRETFDSVRRIIADMRGRADAFTDQGGRGRDGPARMEPLITPPRPGEHRVVVLPFTSSSRSQPQSSGRTSTSGPGDRIADTLRAAIGARPGFSVVDRSRTRDAARSNRVPTMVGAVLFAPAVVTGEYTRRGDSLHVRAQVTCRTCLDPVVREAVVPAARPTTAVAALLEPLLADLAKVQWDRPPRSRGGQNQPPSRGTTPGAPPPSPPPPSPPPPPSA